MYEETEMTLSYPNCEAIALQQELDKHEIRVYSKHRILYEAENKIADLGPIKGFCPKVRYWEYIAQELLIESDYEDWSASDLFEVIRVSAEKEKMRAAKRVLAEWRKKKKGEQEDPKWRGRAEGDEETFG